MRIKTQSHHNLLTESQLFSIVIINPLRVEGIIKFRNWKVPLNFSISRKSFEIFSRKLFPLCHNNRCWEWKCGGGAGDWGEIKWLFNCSRILSTGNISIYSLIPFSSSLDHTSKDLPAFAFWDISRRAREVWATWNNEFMSHSHSWKM